MAIQKKQKTQPLLLTYSLLGVVIGIIIALVIVQKYNNKSDYGSPIIIRDTTWVVKDSTIYSKPQIIKTIPVEIISKEYIPDTNYAILVKQYQKLVQEHLSQNIQSDSIKIDSIGYVYVKDTVSKNVISGRSTNYNLKYPTIKETILIPEKPKNEIYLGIQAGVPANINAGVILKDKKQHIYGISTGINSNGNIQYGIQSYWKISLKHKP